MKIRLKSENVELEIKVDESSVEKFYMTTKEEDEFGEEEETGEVEKFSEEGEIGEEPLELDYYINEKVEEQIRPILEKHLEPIFKVYRQVAEEIDVVVTEITSEVEEEYGIEPNVVANRVGESILNLYSKLILSTMMPPSLNKG